MARAVILAMGRTCDSMLSSLTELALVSIRADLFVALDALRKEALAAEPPTGRALALADREDEIGSWLDGRGVADAWQLAPVLAGAGVDTAWCERVAGAVGADGLGGALGWIVSVLTANDLLTEMRDTTTRIANLVEAVKSYSQMDRADQQRVDLCEGIDSTLAMLSHKLDGIEVVRVYDPDLPQIEVSVGELNQVWTNLIDNAIDAMDGDGMLRITTRTEGPYVVVDIADTGHGMPDAVQSRAFEPFFTTKDVGKGTGLGLDISRRIVVERHRGEISFDSSPAGTTAHVHIPVTPL